MYQMANNLQAMLALMHMEGESDKGIAKKIGVSQSTITRIRNGGSLGNRETAVKIIKFYQEDFARGRK